MCLLYALRRDGVFSIGIYSEMKWPTKTFHFGDNPISVMGIMNKHIATGTPYARSADLLRLLSLASLFLRLTPPQDPYGASSFFVSFSSLSFYSWRLTRISYNRLLQFATVGNHDRRKGLVAAVGASSLNSANNVHSLNHLSEHDVLSIQMRSGNLGK